MKASWGIIVTHRSFKMVLKFLWKFPHEHEFLLLSFIKVFISLYGVAAYILAGETLQRLLPSNCTIFLKVCEVLWNPSEWKLLWKLCFNWAIIYCSVIVDACFGAQKHLPHFGMWIVAVPVSSRLSQEAMLALANKWTLFGLRAETFWASEMSGRVLEKRTIWSHSPPYPNKLFSCTLYIANSSPMMTCTMTQVVKHWSQLNFFH